MAVAGDCRLVYMAVAVLNHLTGVLVTVDWCTWLWLLTVGWCTWLWLVTVDWCTWLWLYPMTWRTPNTRCMSADNKIKHLFVGNGREM